MTQARLSWGVGLALLGAASLLDALAVVDLWTAGGWWPVLLVVAGVVLVIRHTDSKRSTGANSRFVVLGARSAEVSTRPYPGGRVTAMLGHVDYDLRGTTLPAEGADVTVRVVLGDVAVTVPPGWRVRVAPRLLLADLDEQVLPASPDGPTLTVRGTVLLADLHVRTGSVVE
jgi:hypothetical protein